MKNETGTVRAFAVEAIGFNPTERIVLGSIFNLSQRRSPRYERFAGGVYARPDILLVDASEAQYVEQAKLVAAAKSVPVILVGDRDFGTGWPVVPRPLQWARVFRAFDLAVGLSAAATDLDEPPPSALVATVASTPPAPLPAAKKNIPGAPWVLVVDDSAPVRAEVARLLEPLGLNIDTAGSGEHAIGMTAGRQYACIFLDVMLPGVDGYQVCKLIKAKPTGQSSPVIMLTSKSSPFDRIRGTMAGCDSYLVKPIDAEKLRTTVVRLLRASERAGQ